MRVEDLREQHSMLHFTFLFNTEIGSVDKACEKEQVPTGYLIRLLTCVLQCIVWSAAFSLATCSQSKQLTTPSVSVKVFVPSVYCLSDPLSYGVV